LENIEVVDEKTIRFILNESELNYYYMLDILTAIILPEHRWKNLEDSYGERIFYEFLDNDPKEIKNFINRPSS